LAGFTASGCTCAKVCRGQCGDEDADAEDAVDADDECRDNDG
jgi:hypothetical protein